MLAIIWRPLWLRRWNRLAREQSSADASFRCLLAADWRKTAATYDLRLTTRVIVFLIDNTCIGRLDSTAYCVATRRIRRHRDRRRRRPAPLMLGCGCGGWLHRMRRSDAMACTAAVQRLKNIDRCGSNCSSVPKPINSHVSHRVLVNCTTFIHTWASKRRC